MDVRKKRIMYAYDAASACVAANVPIYDCVYSKYLRLKLNPIGNTAISKVLFWLRCHSDAAGLFSSQTGSIYFHFSFI